MQPIRPHGHRRPSDFTTTWPISPAAPRPSHIWPSSTIPPPTPVPQKTPSSERYGLPAPSSNSAWVATLTSFESATGAASAASSFSPSGYVPSQSGRLRALVTVPSSSSTAPGEPTPTAVSPPGPTAASSLASRTAATMARATSAGPPVVGVGWREEPSTSCCSSTTTAWIFVPPRSMPPYRAIAPLLPTRQRIRSIPGSRRTIRAEPGEQLLRVPALGARAPDDLAMRARPVRVRPGVRLRAPERERRLARDGPLARADRRQQPRRPQQLRRRRLDRPVEGPQPARPDRRTRQHGDRPARSHRRRVRLDRPDAAPGAVGADGLEADGVGLAPERAPA